MPITIAPSHELISVQHTHMDHYSRIVPQRAEAINPFSNDSWSFSSSTCAFSPELFRPADMYPVSGAARMRLVWRSQQHRKGSVHGGVISGSHEETGEAEPVPGHDTGARQLPQRQGLWVGLHPMPRWDIHFLFILLKLQIMCHKWLRLERLFLHIDSHILHLKKRRNKTDCRYHEDLVSAHTCN